MRVWVGMAGLALLSLIAACGPFVGRPGRLEGSSFTDEVWHFSLKVPDGWRDTTPVLRVWRSAEKARFGSPDGLASTAVYVVPVGDSDCAEEIEKWLRDSKLGEPVSSLIGGSMWTRAGELPTWKGDIEALNGATRGLLSSFCDGGSAIVLVGLGSKNLTQTRRLEMESLVNSFGYLRGNPVTSTPAPTPTPRQHLVHEVRSRGETLQAIAECYTGSAENWTKLSAPLNPDLTDCCVVLRIGRKVRIPMEIVAQTKPCPIATPTKRPPTRTPTAREPPPP